VGALQVGADLAPGCPEKLPSLGFFKWICWDYPRRSRPKLLALLDQSKKSVVILRSREDVERYAQR